MTCASTEQAETSDRYPGRRDGDGKPQPADGPFAEAFLVGGHAKSPLCRDRLA